MRITSNIFILGLATFFFSCNSEERFPVSKQYWDFQDYGSVLWEINRMGDEKLPTMDDSEYSAVFKKMIDPINYKVALDDDQLGSKYKNELAKKYFNNLKGLSEPYSKQNRQDKYLYEKEFILTSQFFLGFQPYYFDTYIDLVKETSEDAGSTSVKSNVTDNVNILFNNYSNYLDFIKYESSFSDDGLALISKGITTYFIPLLDKFPEHGYLWRSKAINLKNKTKSSEVELALQELIDHIEQNELP